MNTDAHDLFTCRPTHQPEGIDIEKITSRAVWPTFTPQTSKRRYADISLLRHCHEKNLWNSIGKCWLTCLFARGQVVYHKVRKLWYVVMCEVLGTMLLVWQLVRLQLGSTNHACLLLLLYLIPTQYNEEKKPFLHMNHNNDVFFIIRQIPMGQI